MDWLLREVRHAVRRIRQQPAFAAGVIAILALAIGSVTAIFTLVNAILLKPLPLRDPGDLIAFTIRRADTDRHPLSLLALADIQAANRTLTGIASYFGWSVNLTGVTSPERLQGLRVSPDYFDLTGTPVLIGRPLAASDERANVVVISHGLWQRHFGAAPDVTGRSIVLNGAAYEIVGVLRPDFICPTRDQPDLLAPFSPAADPRRANRAQAFLRVIGRLRDGVTLAQARDDLDALISRLKTQHPEHAPDLGVRLVSLDEEITGARAPMLRMLMVAVCLLMLVAGANLATLFLVRGAVRGPEIALRRALGASRSRVFSQLVVEAAVIAGVAATLGLLVSYIAVSGLIAIVPTGLPRVGEIGLDARVAVLALTLAAAVTIVLALIPTIHAPAVDLRATLEQGGRSRGAAGRRIRSGLIFAEAGLSTLLLVTAGLFARSFQQVQAVDPGFQAAEALTIRLSLPRSRYTGAADIDRFYQQLDPEVRALPSVRAVAAANVVPMNGYLATTTFTIEGSGVSPEKNPEAHYRMITPDFFRAMGVPVIRGRAFNALDTQRSSPVVLVNQSFAARYFPSSDPVGAKLRLSDGTPEPRLVEIIGVVGDVKHLGLERIATIDLYVPITQVPDATTVWLANNMYLVVRTDGDPSAVTRSVQNVVTRIDKDVPASYVRTMGAWLDTSLAPRRFNLQLVVLFAASALLLALVGIYAVVSGAVAQRTREIGIRAALGATRRQVVALVVGDALRPVATGIAVGLLGALVVGRAVSEQLFGVTPHDPAAFAAAAVLLGASAWIASEIPGRRAARIDPNVALRVD